MSFRSRRAGRDPASRGRGSGAWIPAFAGMTVGTGWLYGIVKRSSIRECPVISGNSPDTLGYFWALINRVLGKFTQVWGLAEGQPIFQTLFCFNDSQKI